MPSYFPYAAGVLVVAAIWVGVLVYMDLFTPEDVKAWRRLAGLRGYATPRSGLARAAERAPLLLRLQRELDLTRLLAIAGRYDTPLGFMASTTAQALGITAALIALDVVYRVFEDDWVLGLPPLVFVFVFAGLLLLGVATLRMQAQRRQEQADKALGDMMMLVAIMTDSRGLQLEDAIRILSRCISTPVLQDLIDQRGYQRLVKQRPGTTIELLRMIAEEYRIPTFAMVADAAANANVGFSERETYTRLAGAVYQGRLADARRKAAQAKILVTLPVAGMLIPLLVLLGAPTFASLANSLR